MKNHLALTFLFMITLVACKSEKKSDEEDYKANNQDVTGTDLDDQGLKGAESLYKKVSFSGIKINPEYTAPKTPEGEDIRNPCEGKTGSDTEDSSWTEYLKVQTYEQFGYSNFSSCSAQDACEGSFFFQLKAASTGESGKFENNGGSSQFVAGGKCVISNSRWKGSLEGGSFNITYSLTSKAFESDAPECDDYAETAKSQGADWQEACSLTIRLQKVSP